MFVKINKKTRIINKKIKKKKWIYAITWFLYFA